ncbi:hypothetical protein NC661_00160 [Aquibacillus koreensis]|uniref:YpoC-like domain-containing protein n=1 Tax=Aquibacillus koreensis TaxID=279446 RepID=A0A9X4AGC2_9BACI|nr:hypothetical protein [Aquibacillus koreensis]MCT2537350.1 hypothetical protein [Aquibacillus koreensis]MDC3418796.1 hypothetical protein [Aquibacillus koreensis]
MFESGFNHIQNWNKLSTELADLYSQRKGQQAMKQMDEQIANFKQALYLVNGFSWSENCNFKEDIATFKYKPFNIVERIEFIHNFTQQYHSYIQLNELYKELEKIYAKAMILESK